MVRIGVNKTVRTLWVLIHVAAGLDIDLTVMDEAVMVCNSIVHLKIGFSVYA